MAHSTSTSRLIGADSHDAELTVLVDVPATLVSRQRALALEHETLESVILFTGLAVFGLRGRSLNQR